MFFPQRIIGIQPGMRVLDVGPGGSPHPLATTMLDIEQTEEEALAQSGFVVPAKDARTVYYQGGRFPFADDSFDYVIASHVIEHVPDPDQFFRELQRVAPKGYLEFPTILYDYLYGFTVHPNLLLKSGNYLKWQKKDDHFLFFQPVQDLLRSSLQNGYCYEAMTSDLADLFFQGFEWKRGELFSQKTDLLTELIPHCEVPRKQLTVPSTKELIREICRRVIKRLMPKSLT
jgi:SAM-dependent methyltransferase